MEDSLKKLTEVLEQRKTQDPNESYVASLYAAGLDKILKKIGEESAEVIMAAKDGDPAKIIHETADYRASYKKALFTFYRPDGVALADLHPSICRLSTVRADPPVYPAALPDSAFPRYHLGQGVRLRYHV